MSSGWAQSWWQQIPQEYSWPYQFHVIAQKEINAFALPGGPIFINLGTITAADNEAELAGVMAHEMSHVYMQHSAKQAGKTNWIAGIAGLAGAVLGSGGFIGQLAAAGIQMGANGVIMKYSRTDEAQADAVGAIIMYKAGYNPEALAEFFQKLAEEGGSGPQWLSDHPNPGNRQEAIQKEIANWPPKRYDTDNASFVQAKQQAEGLKGYTAQQIAQGAKTWRMGFAQPAERCDVPSACGSCRKPAGICQYRGHRVESGFAAERAAELAAGDDESRSGHASRDRTIGR